MSEPGKKSSTTSAVDGGVHQSVARLDLLLDALSTEPEDGLKLMEVCRLTGLGKATAHRLLTGLVAYGLADYDAATARYFVGMKILGWASGVGNRYGLAKMAAPALRRLAKIFEDAVYLTVRSGDEAVCVERVEGAYPIKTLAFRVGDHRPLGIGAGSAAMLAALPDPEVARILGTHLPQRRSFGISDEEVWATVRETRAAGHAAVDGKIVPGICTVGVAILLDDLSPIAAISVSAIRDRMGIERRAEIAAAIKDEVAAIARDYGPVLTAGGAARLAAAATR